MLERFRRLVDIRRGEGPCAIRFACYAFVLLVCYYIVKTLREPLLLADGSAELRSYAFAAIALASLVIVPLYSVLYRRTDRKQLTRWVTLLFTSNLALFGLLGQSNVSLGFVYFVWTGIFGVTMLAQFWAYASDAFNVHSGRRILPLIMGGATVGALVGPLLVGSLFRFLGPWGLTELAAVLLAATLPLIGCARTSIPSEARSATGATMPVKGTVFGGITVVLRDRFLLLLSLVVLLLNCVNTTGDFMLTAFVLEHVGGNVAGASAGARDALIAGFFSSYYFSVNALSLLLQLVVVTRVLRAIGAGRALLILPALTLAGYGILAFFPLFGVIHLVKLIENSTDYSLMNTTRQLIYLPLPDSHKFEGKTTIETFFWRLGDVMQAVLIFVGIRLLGFGYEDFAVTNVLLIALWLGLAKRLSHLHDDISVGPARRRCNRLAVLASVLALMGPIVTARPIDPAQGGVRTNPIVTVAGR